MTGVTLNGIRACECRTRGTTVDYQALNKVTVKNKRPVLLITDLFDHLSKARYFLDLQLGYCHVRIAEKDMPKITMVTRYISYEFLVLPFSLIDAPTTFCNLMKNVFY